MEKKYKIRFSDEDALQESIVYKLVSEYGIEPVVLRAEIEGSGGILLIKMRGEESQINTAISNLGRRTYTSRSWGSISTAIWRNASTAVHVYRSALPDHSPSTLRHMRCTWMWTHA